MRSYAFTHVQPVKTEISRICHWSLMQTEKSEPKDKRMMQETSFAQFLALSINWRTGISGSTSETDDQIFFLPIIGNFLVLCHILL